MSESFIYFLRPVGQPGPIKIGYSARPEKRREYFNARSPIPLELVLAVPGGSSKLEFKLHLAFADAHSHSEWFNATPRLLDMIEALRAGVPFEELDLRPTGKLNSSRMGAAAWSDGSKRAHSLRARLRGAANRAGLSGAYKTPVSDLIDVAAERPLTDAEWSRFNAYVEATRAA